jgi:aspartate/glutamate racemase
MSEAVAADLDAIALFDGYLKVTGVAHTDPEPEGDPQLLGKRLGLLNGSSWITLWANYFGRRYLPGVHLVNIGSEAVQISFMQAHDAGLPTPPPNNIQAFVNYARDLVELAQVDAVLITCSTMNRSYPQVQQALATYGVPVMQIDRPMMARAVQHGGKVLVVATHGPTVQSTQDLLKETAVEMGQEVSFAGTTIEEAWYHLAEGDVRAHNRALADGIRQSLADQDPASQKISSVVLAQLSMSVFLLSYPNPQESFGVPVFTSGQCGFEAMRDVLVAA